MGTSLYLEEKFRELGYEELVKAGDIPGFYTVVDTGRPGPEVLILAEMDSLICPNHPESDPQTGYVHACGHHAQCAALLGVAGALKDPAVLGRLWGRIRLCAVPAEELIEIEYRTELKNKGIIRYYGGKGEFLCRGYFDGVDMAFMVHTSDQFAVRQGSVGCIAKSITYKGRSAHGAAAWEGINALYAASQGMSAVNALRETFMEEDMIRFHPIVTHGGEAVNAIPEKVTMESYVRGSTFEAMIRENRKINRALSGAALSIGGNVEINDFPGYAPLYNDRNMINLVKAAAEIALPHGGFRIHGYMNQGSIDMGELCGLMPAVHPYVAGAAGICHGDDYRIEDPYTACVMSAKWQLAMLLLLLENEAALAKKIISEFNPRFATKEEYLKYVDQINCHGDRIIYHEDGSATVRV
ncbi:MAG: M20/M25/M40 family metallo-hydrolase [Clostridia bacterium]|nr:M20/M25/M40 family metallo-hydrolase [Clostridia bacterium]